MTIHVLFAIGIPTAAFAIGWVVAWRLGLFNHDID